MSAMPPQIAKLIPRLASEHDGEVVATVRAIERVLRTAGLDWHALSAAVEVPEHTAFTYDYSGFNSRPAPQRPQPAPPPKSRDSTWPTWSQMQRSRQLAWCDVLLKHVDMDAKTIDFVADVREKLYVGQCFDLKPRDKRRLTALIMAAIQAGNAARAAA